MDLSGMGAGDIDRLLEDTRRAIGRMHTESAPPPEARGEGTAADGQVRAIVVTGGRLEKLEVDSRAMRLGSGPLCDEIVVAVNAALDDLRGVVLKTVPELPDPAELEVELDELRVESVRRMEMFTQGVADAVAQIIKATEGRHGT
ncbi:MAG: hypothetical protein JWN00_2501 [Actinomycetia bacterium]|nr:hypothetical protein [Actinomycetes bacterium]